MQELEATLADLQGRDVVGRIWGRDHTVWKPHPDEIANRLGWLDIGELMREQAPALESFAQEALDAGFEQVVLLGMGGSSLGPEVFRATFGSADQYPTLTMLDSTVPAQVWQVTRSLDPARTLFLVCSKSGSTVEPNALYRHFRALVEGSVGEEHAGHSFVAITDEGTSLETLAHDQGFRSVFLNAPDIGGRYSVLSYFGLVPASLMGLDLREMLDRAGSMRDACTAGIPAENPGAQLGAKMGVLALEGRDKLTLVTSPSIRSFGLWAEQLLAESTGKEGKGIVPVADEPVLGPEEYGDDRLFIFLRLESDDNSALDATVAELRARDDPVVRLDIKDPYDLCGELFRWQFATAVAGCVLGINPFDQPDVEGAKRQTVNVLREFEDSGKLPDTDSGGSMVDLLSKAAPGDYLAVMAFLRQTPELDDGLARLRAAVMKRYKIATTVGYGPRFLHSTGQLHKGGPGTGLFLQLTAGHVEDVAIPGEAYSLGVMADAQALGDLRALREKGRRVIRVHLGTEPEAEVEGLAAQVG